MYTSVMLCGGTLVMGIAVLWFIGNMIFVSRSEEAQGVIVGESRGSKSGTHPLVGFKTRDGKTVEFVDNSSFNGLLTGLYALYQRFVLKQQDTSTVKVAYNPSNPSSARIKNFIHLQDNPIMVFLFGIVFTLLGLLPAEFVNKLTGFLEKLPF